ncbi:hypothetical protein N8I77_012597 [Diaporthe amygdali]|uniref:Uncharacterized protein n=1 Tax=Phomopsis amygdali TaxID=1214568 RepID=A0AAD9S320_PHOAM|nr:hypothetical protein N8I77_012597 [Diaporthe amygdali]
MAPQTRSRTSGDPAQSSLDDLVTRTASEAPSKSSATKKLKVYKRSEPAPRQLHFPARNKTVRTYGKGKARRSLPSKIPDQSTLTQIGWIPSTYQEEEDDMDGLIDLTMDDEDDAHAAEDRKTTRRSKRRKTTGDLEIVPNSTAGSSFHTQTLTQMPSFMSGQQPEDDELEENFKLDDEDGEHKDAAKVADSEEEFEPLSPLKERKKSSTPSPHKAVLKPTHGTTPSQVSQTPRKQTVDREVIPSSQPSPFTPNLGIGERYWSQMDRTPLKERSTNVDAPTPTVSKKRPRTLEIADSWSTVNGGMSSSPLKGKVHRTPLKEMSLDDLAERSIVLGESPVHGDNSSSRGEAGNTSVDLGTQNALKVRSPERGEGKNLSQKSTRSEGDIVLDSEDEFDFELEDDSGANDEAPGTPTPAARAYTQENMEVVAQETEAPVQSPQKSIILPSSRPATQRHPTPDPLPENDEAEPETPSPSPQRRPSISSIIEADKETPLSSPQKTSPALPPMTQLGSSHRSHALSSPQKNSPAMPPVSQLGFRYKSQAFESQRVPFERIQQLGPQTDRSDIIISVHPDHAEQIAEGVKTHEFRNYRIPQTVARIWMYITKPVCALKYMATISGAKEPGEISPDDSGVGNEEFNQGKGPKFAYELKQVYQLNNPVSLKRMKENGWVEEAPAKYVYVPPAVLGELMGNLRCALFVEPGEPQSSQVDMSVSQEVEMQLRSDIAHSTQLDHMRSSPLQSQRRPDTGDADIIPSSQGRRKEPASSPPHETIAATDKPVFAKPAVPPSRSQRSVHWVEDSPVGKRALSPQHAADNPATVRPSQATTASAPSSPSQRLPSYREQQPIVIPSQSQPSIPVSPPTATKAAPRPQVGRQSSGLLSDFEVDAVVGDSPVRRRGAGTHSSALLSGSSQGFTLGSGEMDSLLDDSKIRQPPEVVWDSEGEI